LTAPVHIHTGGLRRLRELRGLNALQLAERVGCPVGMVVRAEMGLQVPADPLDRARLAAGYGLDPVEFVRMALDAADHLERGKSR
jgi:transcriptional regulator with XRE-family HTH domain